MPKQKLKRCEQTQACLLSTSWMTSQRMKSQIFNNNKIVKIVTISFLSSAAYTLSSESTDLKQQLSKHLAYVDCIMSGFMRHPIGHNSTKRQRGGSKRSDAELRARCVPSVRTVSWARACAPRGCWWSPCTRWRAGARTARKHAARRACAVASSPRPRRHAHAAERSPAPTPVRRSTRRFTTVNRSTRCTLNDIADSAPGRHPLHSSLLWLASSHTERKFAENYNKWHNKFIF